MKDCYGLAIEILLKGKKMKVQRFVEKDKGNILLKFRSAIILMCLALLILAIGTCVAASAGSNTFEYHQDTGRQTVEKKIPVILDTDIGDDIDDTWALTLLLKMPEFDVKLITTGNAPPRAKIIAKILEIAERTDIPIGVGLSYGNNARRQQDWVKEYDLSMYPGVVRKDGVQAIVDTIMKSKEQITLISIGPLQNIAAAIEKEPEIARRVRFVSMAGSIYAGYGGSSTISKECNIVRHVKASQTIFSTPRNMTITPLDTCGIVKIVGERYTRILNSSDPLLKALIENYHCWLKVVSREPKKHFKVEDINVKSSTLYDPVAIYLAHSTEFLNIEDLGIRVTDEGYTVVDPRAPVIECATSWKSLDGFKDFLVSRLTCGDTKVTSKN